jgi:hypothetical protein
VGWEEGRAEIVRGILVGMREARAGTESEIVGVSKAFRR